MAGAAAFQLEAADDDRGRASRLAHHQARARGDVVRDGKHSCVQRLARVVWRATEVDRGRQAGHAKRDVDDAQPPRPPERVRDDDSHDYPGELP